MVGKQLPEASEVLERPTGLHYAKSAHHNIHTYRKACKAQDVIILWSLWYVTGAILSELVKGAKSICLFSEPVLCIQVQLRLQRPTVVAEIGFMLSVTKFFVPGVTMSGITPTPFESSDVVLEGKLANQAGLPESTFLCTQLSVQASLLRF